jgi:catechol 1,2-dioxygenase
VTITHPIYLPLTTQIYMKGDPFIAKDPWAKHSKNIVTIDKKSAAASGQIEIVLANRPGQRA